MEREDTGPDTGEIELQRILTCLKENGYTFESLEDGVGYGCMIAKFNKEIAYSDADGNYINDRKIDVKIEFDTDFDYTKKRNIIKKLVMMKMIMNTKVSKQMRKKGVHLLKNYLEIFPEVVVVEQEKTEKTCNNSLPNFLSLRDQTKREIAVSLKAI